MSGARLFAGLAVNVALGASAVSGQTPPVSNIQRKQATAARVASGAIRVDGRLDDYGELLVPRDDDRLLYGTHRTTMEVREDGSRVVGIGDLSYTLRNRDFNTLSFRSNVVLRWEWRPGSTLYLVWQQDRANSEAIGSYVSPADMFRSVTAPGRGVFVVKTSFWLPIG